MSYRALRPEDFEWITRPHDPGEPARHVAELSERAGFGHVRGNLWRYEPGAKGRRHRHPVQEETFVVVAGTPSMYLGDPPERVDLAPGSVVVVQPNTALQIANDGADEAMLFIVGAPPEQGGADFLPDAGAA